MAKYLSPTIAPAVCLCLIVRVDLYCRYGANWFSGFESEANFVLSIQVGKKGSQRGQFNLISSVAASPNDDILVADSRIQIFNSDGEFKREIFSEGKGLFFFTNIYLLNKLYK